MINNRSPKELERLHKALASVSRLRILQFLSPGREQSVEEIAEPVGMTSHAVSHHIRILWNAGFLDRRKKGLHVFYRIAKDKHPLLRATLKMFT